MSHSHRFLTTSLVQGKRFASLAEVRDWVAGQTSDVEDDEEEDGSKRRRKRKKKRLSGPSRGKRLRFDEEAVQEMESKVKAREKEFSGPVQQPVKLSEEILKRRKLMTARSPFKNLLKRTLVKFF